MERRSVMIGTIITLAVLAYFVNSCITPAVASCKI
jgi:hypothetical protein